MTDDPRDILRAAGVECPEVGAVFALHRVPWPIELRAVLALARLVAHWKDAADMRHEDAECYEQRAAKYQWQRDEAIRQHTWHWGPDMVIVQPSPHETGKVIADLDRRWDELHP